MKHLYILLLLLGSSAGSAFAQQFTYDIDKMPSVARAGVSNMSSQAPDYEPYVMRLAPAPGGEAVKDELARAKELVALRYPYKESQGSVSRAVADAPSLRENFVGPNQSLGIPLDTHLAVSDSGQVVVVANFEVAVYDTDGTQVTRQSLQAFFASISPISTVFDPKVHYDPEEDRFIIIALAFTSSRSHVYIAFSQTNDAAGAYNSYVVEGDPFSNGSFFDYPMASLSHQELFLTGNSVVRGEPWQTGFVETLLYQIDKRTGYAGDSLEFYVWSNLTALGSKLRNLCPVKGATGNYGPNHYFLSNRNFDVSNDTILMIQIHDTMALNLPWIDMQLIQSNTAYGAPPNARQLGNNTLATNDARVLDAFLFNDRIQFVSNTVNPVNGFPAIYYGIIDSVSGNPQVTASILSSDTLEYGYPSIAYTGSGDIMTNDQDAIIFCDYSENQDFPGTGSWYVNNNGELSDFTISKVGDNLINVLTTNSERWGDYTGCQRKYNSPGEVWTMGTFGLAAGARRIANPYISQWLRPDLVISREPVVPQVDLVVYPNPASGRVQLDFVVEQGQQVEISLHDLQGRELNRFFSYPAGRAGEHRFSFDTTPLPAGIYMLSIEVDGAGVAAKRLVVE